MNINSRTVVGIDLALGGTGLVAIPLDWGGDWYRVAHATARASAKAPQGIAASVGRMTGLRDDILRFCAQAQPVAVALLGYAFSKSANAGFTAGELGGIVKLGLVEAGYDVRGVIESSARTLLGKLPPTRATKNFPTPPKQKEWAIGRLAEAGCPVAMWGENELDAFVAANAVLAEVTQGAALILREAA